MLTLILAITTVICALGWLVYWVSSMALTMWILGKGYTPPSDGEMEACCKEVWKKLLRIR